MQSIYWYIREHEGDGDNYLHHKFCKIKFDFEFPLEKTDQGFYHHGYFYGKNDNQINTFKNTTDLIFLRCDLKDGERARKMKMFGVNLDVNQLEDLINNAQDCLKKLKLNSF